MFIKHLMPGKLLKKISLSLVSIIILSFNAGLYAQNFAEARKNINQSLSRIQVKTASVKLAIIFETEQQETLRQRINLVNFRRGLAQSFLKDYQVADPVLTSTTLERQNINTATIQSNPEQLQATTKLLGNNYFLFVRIRPLGEDLAVQYHLVDPQATTVHEAEYFYPLSSLQQAMQEDQLEQEESDAEESFFELGQLQQDEDLSWSYFAPAAPISPYTFSLDVGLGLRNAEEAQVAVGQIRFDFTTSIFQVGTQTYGTREGAHHSTYVYSKVNVFNPDSTQLPISLSLGVKGRIYWNENNKDYDIKETGRTAVQIKTDKDLSGKNKRRDRLAFFLAFQMHAETLNLVTDFYVDSQKAVFGAKLLLPANTRLFGEVLARRFKSDFLKATDTAFGIEHLPLSNIKLYVVYQQEKQQTVFGGRFSL